MLVQDLEIWWLIKMPLLRIKYLKSSHVVLRVWLRVCPAREAIDCQSTVVNHDSRNPGFIDNETIDLVCTHPPYMAAVPYAEYQKLSLWWLGYDQNDLDKSLIGGRRICMTKVSLSGTGWKTIVRPSRLVYNFPTFPGMDSSVLISFPVCISNTFRVPPSEADTTFKPSWVIQCVEDLCPHSSALISLPVCISHNCRVPSCKSKITSGWP